MKNESISILWLKRDLRTHDHACLELCSKLSLSDPEFKVLLLYIDESGYWESNKASLEQREFVQQCLRDLNINLKKIQNKVYVANQAKSAVDVFKSLAQFYTINCVFCHRETGNAWTFERDKHVKKYLKETKIDLLELKQDCLERGSKERSRATSNRELHYRYERFYNQTQHQLPLFLRHPNKIPRWLEISDQEYNELGSGIKEIKGDLSFKQFSCPRPQLGGETQALEILRTFLDKRCLSYRGYRTEMSNPLKGREACSRISPHLSWGSLSHRKAFQMATGSLLELDPRSPKHKQLQSFITRLAWRSHFMQKFETLFWMEYKCINPDLENLRGWSEEYFQRWKEGQTGYPFVDACMRSLNATKWLNFRARAMVVSFASYALNLDWRGFGPHLASNFLDYEPGIHYSQLQMQGGTTTGSTTRIYSPLKQSVEKDPSGDFIRLWVPELRDIKTSLIHIPADATRNGYPRAIIPQERLWPTMRANAPTKTRQGFRMVIRDSSASTGTGTGNSTSTSRANRQKNKTPHAPYETALRQTELAFA